MQVTETSSEGLKRELQIVVAAAELDSKLNEKLNEVKDKVQLKGFRPGKVPPAHIKKIYGKSMMAEIIQETVSDTSRNALVERDERPAFQPDIKLTEDEKEIEEIMAGKADLSYTMSFEILPTVEPMDLKSIKLDRPVATIDVEEVERRLQELVKSATTYEAREGRAAVLDDQVKIDFVGTIDGEEFPGGKAEDAFHVVVPSLVGFGFSGKPKKPGWSVNRMSEVMAKLMARLGYTEQEQTRNP